LINNIYFVYDREVSILRSSQLYDSSVIWQNVLSDIECTKLRELRALVGLVDPCFRGYVRAWVLRGSNFLFNFWNFQKISKFFPKFESFWEL